jgi:hypothetical protein
VCACSEGPACACMVQDAAIGALLIKLAGVRTRLVRTAHTGKKHPPEPRVGRGASHSTTTPNVLVSLCRYAAVPGSCCTRSMASLKLSSIAPRCAQWRRLVRVCVRQLAQHSAQHAARVWCAVLLGMGCSCADWLLG